MIKGFGEKCLWHGFYLYFCNGIKFDYVIKDNDKYSI